MDYDISDWFILLIWKKIRKRKIQMTSTITTTNNIYS